MQVTEARPWYRHWPEGVPKSVDYPNVSFPELLRKTARRFPDKPAMNFFGTVLRYREYDEAVDRFASGLRRIGVEKGDRVGLLLPNTPHFFIAFFGILRAGAIVVQSSPLYSGRELEYLYHDAGASTVVAMDLFWPTLAKTMPVTPVRQVVVCDMKDFLRAPLRQLYPLKKRRELKKAGHWPLEIPEEPWIHRYRAVASTPADSACDVHASPDDVAVLQYTGGTTGVPKGAMLTHRNLVACGMQCMRFIRGQSKPERILQAVPAFHIYGLAGGIYTTVTGSELVLEPNARDVGHMLKLIQKTGPNFFAGVPTMFIAMMRHPKTRKYDLSSLETCISGGGPLPAAVQKEFQGRIRGHLAEAYGLTESTAMATAHFQSEDRLGKGGVGIPLPDTDIRLVDLDTGTTDVPRGERGELILRGPQVMKGYWNMPQETALTLRDGWLYTGDIATMDEDGYVYIVDRKKDMIIASGFKVYPRDVEEVLYMHPSVAQAAVIGVPDAYRGETVKAFVVLKPGATATGDEISSLCKEWLAPFKVPKIVEFRHELPMSPVGKVLRRELKEQERERRGG